MKWRPTAQGLNTSKGIVNCNVILIVIVVCLAWPCLPALRTPPHCPSAAVRHQLVWYGSKLTELTYTFCACPSLPINSDVKAPLLQLLQILQILQYLMLPSSTSPPNTTTKTPPLKRLGLCLFIHAHVIAPTSRENPSWSPSPCLSPLPPRDLSLILLRDG